MPTNVSMINNTNIKMRFREPYVSEGLNKKLNGIAPPGIIRGGRITPSPANCSVVIAADDEFGDSVFSYVTASGVHLTYRIPGGVRISLAAAASSTGYLALYLKYTTTADTLGYWQVYTEAELFGGALQVAEADEVIILGKVVIPAAGAVIVDADITPTHRREAWAAVSPGVREWRLVTPEGSFDHCKLESSPITDDPWPGWASADLVVAGMLDAAVVNTLARSGANSFKITLSGATKQACYMPYSGLIGVEEGQLLDCSVWVRGVAVLPDPRVAGYIGLKVRFYTVAGVKVSTEYISDTSLTGTFSWTEVREILAVPATAVSMRVWVYFDDNSENSTGALYFDDVRIFVESGRPQDPKAVEDQYQAQVKAAKIDIVPPNTVLGTTDVVSQSLRFKQTTIAAGVLQLLLSSRGGPAAYPFLATLDGGGLVIDRLIESLGADLIGSAANAARARITTSIPAQATSEHVLLLELPQISGGFPIRIYASDATPILSGTGAIFATINAKWDPATNQWGRDVLGDSSLVGFVSDGMTMVWYPAVGAAPWANGDWTAVGTPLLSVLQGGGAHTQAEINDATLRFTGSTAHTNPAAYGATSTNMLYAKNIEKVWGIIKTEGAATSVALLDGFGIASVGLTTEGRIEILFNHDFSSESYSSQIQGYVTPAVARTDTWWVTSQVAGKATIELQSNVPALIDLNTIISKVSYRASGEQSS